MSAFRDGNCTGETVERVAKERVIRGDEAPLVLPDVVDFAGHVVVTANNVYFVLEEERLVADAQLVHGVQAAPRLALHIEQMHLAVPICVLAADENDLRWRDGQG